MAAADGTIEIVPHASTWRSFLVLAHWNRLSIEIDGVLRRFRWGMPGEHRVVVGMIFSKVGVCTVQVEPSQTIRLRYTPSLSIYRPGELEIEHVPIARLVP